MWARGVGGAWAGPLVTCAVVISKDWPFVQEVKDSKKFTGDNAEIRREAVARKILKNVTYSLVSIPSQEVDQKGVHKCNIEALGRAITQVIAKHMAEGCVGTYGVVVDGNMPITYEIGGARKIAISLPKADELIPAVSGRQHHRQSRTRCPHAQARREVPRLRPGKAQRLRH